MPQHDVLAIGGATFSGTFSQNAARLDGFQVSQGMRIKLDSDNVTVGNVSGGVLICDRNAPPSARVTAAPTQQPGSEFFTMRASTPNLCYVDNAADNECIGANPEGAFPVGCGYQCTFVTLLDMSIWATEFYLDDDVLTIGGVNSTGSIGPRNQKVSAGTTIVWTSHAGSGGMFQICDDGGWSHSDNWKSRAGQIFVGVSFLVPLGVCLHRLIQKRRRRRQERFAVLVAAMNPNDEPDGAQPADAVHTPESVPPPPYNDDYSSQPEQPASGTYYPQEQPLMPCPPYNEDSSSQPEQPASGSSYPEQPLMPPNYSENGTDTDTELQ